MAKSFFASVLVFSITTACFGQEYKPADQGSTVNFEIKNFGFNSKGSFSGLDGKIIWDPKDVSKAAFDVSISAASVNTDNETRDSHLKKEGYFEVEKYPRIRLVATSISGSGNGGHYTFNGKLTMKSTTKDVSFPFVATPMGNDIIFKGDFTINRRDFDVGGGSTLSNNLTVSLTVLAKKQ
jgi:polyisoprenoid-binding protein YceI